MSVCLRHCGIVFAQLVEHGASVVGTIPTGDVSS